MTPLTEAARLTLHSRVNVVPHWPNGRPLRCYSCPLAGTEYPSDRRECHRPPSASDTVFNPIHNHPTCPSSFWDDLAAAELDRLTRAAADLEAVLPILSDRLLIDAPEALRVAYERGRADAAREDAAAILSEHFEILMSQPPDPIRSYGLTPQIRELPEGSVQEISGTWENPEAVAESLRHLQRLGLLGQPFDTQPHGPIDADQVVKNTGADRSWDQPQ